MASGDRIEPTSLVDWIESTCTTFSSHVCVSGASETLTFAELWRRSIALAQALQTMGVRRGECVGLLVEQDADQLVGMVAIMTAGAAYVPLDPNYPTTRLSQMVLDSGMSFVVTPDRLRTIADSLAVQSVAMTGWTADDSIPRAQVGRDDIAYVIFTSGSTGRPKGVVIEHGAIMTYLQWMIDDWQFQPGERNMGTASPNFDFSMPNFLLPLVTGGNFVALSANALRDGRELATALKMERPRWLQTSPTMLRMLTELKWEGDPNLEIWTGGERTAASVIEYLVPRVRSLRNYYGPTETTVAVTVKVLDVDDVDSPIGWPPPQFGCHVLDENGNHVSKTDEGELYITGPTLARGYLNDPVKTDARFVQIRDERGESVRAYSTGDVVRYRDDGSLVVVGRADAQFKIRGYRIEPGDIEVHLMTLDGVVDAVVVGAQRDEDNEAQLVAFVVGQTPPEGEELSKQLEEVLPEYMIPRIYHFVDVFPVALSGKVDRKTLLTEATEALLIAATEVAPAMTVPGDEFEVFIHHTFASTLGLPESSVDTDSDFFELGGTSLRCARLFMQLEDEFDVTLPLSTLLKNPTVRQLAEAVRREKGLGEQEELMNSFKWEQLISAMWTELLQVPGVNPSDNFYQLGGDDRLAQRFLDRFNGENGTHVTLSAFQDAPTIAQLGILVSGEEPRDSLVVLNGAGTQVPFFCIAGAGGLALAFLPLTKAFGPDQPFFGLQAKGLESRALPDYTLSASARRFTSIIREIQPRGPYIIAGHSLGGVIALKVAQQLEDSGQKVALLVIFDSILSPRMVGPVVKSSGQPVAGESTTVKGIVRMRPKLTNVLRLPFLGVVRQRGVAQFESFYKLGIVQSTFARRLRPWTGRAVVYLSDMDPVVIEGGWRHLLKGSWVAVKLDGDHNSMLRLPNVLELVADLKQRIAESLREEAGLKS